MAGRNVEFASNGGRASGYLSGPAAGSGPGVLVIQEWWGLNSHVRSLADRFAGEGFVALAPDLYHGEETREPDEAGKLLMALNVEQRARTPELPRLVWRRPPVPADAALPVAEGEEPVERAISHHKLAALWRPDATSGGRAETRSFVARRRWPCRASRPPVAHRS